MSNNFAIYKNTLRKFFFNVSGCAFIGFNNKTMYEYYFSAIA